ncbi:MAG: Nif3-like dinuclear metal center hexameric protein [Turicibacter sp.]|nr:Nif3-like dinuclear metal center hexameric protein [Turicibacter sp.]
MLISDIIKHLETLFPKSLAYDKDPIGLHIGNPGAPLIKALVTLDVTLDVVMEAIDMGANLIVAHHPFIYRPLKFIDTRTEKGRVVEKCLQHGIAIYAMHTNYDIAKNGMNDVLASGLGLTNARPLSITKVEEYIKLAIFAPESHAEIVRQAMGDAGIGHLGDYSHCTFTSEGTGRFIPLAGSQPFIGTTGGSESVAEVKIEGIALKKDIHKILSQVLKTHPYEEPAYDVFPIAAPKDGEVFGLGRVGDIPAAVPIKEYIQLAKKSLGISYARFSGNLDQTVTTVAVVGGSGSSFMADAKKAGADLYITGDMGFHDAHDALEMGLNVLDVGHYAESMMKHHVAGLLQKEFGTKDVLASQIATDPFQLV